MVLHEPVLVAEVLAGLALRRDGWYVDATYGRGGHSTEILARLGEQGRLLALDKDPQAVADGRKRLGADARFQIEHAGFEDLRHVAGSWLRGRRAHGVLLDYGCGTLDWNTPGLPASEWAHWKRGWFAYVAALRARRPDWQIITQCDRWPVPAPPSTTALAADGIFLEHAGWTLNPADKPAEAVEKFGAQTPMGRPAQPEEIAPAYVFLAAPSCSSYITGEILPIIGGYSGG